MRKDTITPAARRRHLRFFAFFRPIMAFVFKRKANYVWDDLSNIEGPYLLLSNHNTNYDPIFIGIATRNQLYFVSSEHVMRNKFLGGLLNFFLHPILHLKGKAGVKTISDMLRCLKAGYNVAIFPEGNRSFNGVTCDFLPTIGKLARKSGAKLVTFRMEGGYFTQPRWAFTDRCGKLYGHLVHVYDVDELQSMTDDEINDAIRRDIAEDAYETQAREHIAFKGKRLAYGLETTLFTCPKCRKIGHLHSGDNKLICDCGYSLTFNPYGELIAADGSSTTIRALDTMQRDNLTVLVQSLQTARALGEIRPDRIGNDTPGPIFSDDVTVMAIEDHKIISTRTGVLSAYHDHAEFDGRTFLPENIAGMAIRSRNTIVLYSADTGVQYEIKGNSEVYCALKYLYLYEIVTGKKAEV